MSTAMIFIKGCSFIILVLMTLPFAGCGVRTVTDDEKAVLKQLFPPDAVCQYPLQAPGKIFSRLGEGTWSPVDPNDLNSSFECSGGTPMVQIYTDERSSVEVEYAALGTKDGASRVTLTYRATGGAVPNESTFRNTYANLADVISRNAFNSPLPDLPRRKLANLKSYSQSANDNTENFDVGPGFISVTRNVSVNGTITATMRFFSDVGFKLER